MRFTRGGHAKSLTQEKLAATAGIDLTFLQRIERGKSNVGVVILVGLADALGLDPRDLLRLARLPPVRRGRPPSKRGSGAAGRA